MCIVSQWYQTLVINFICQYLKFVLFHLIILLQREVKKGSYLVLWMHVITKTLNVAKCNLGKVNLEVMLVSSFPSYTRGGPMPLAGAPRDLNTQLLACSSS